jgi:hypothetical protein
MSTSSTRRRAAATATADAEAREARIAAVKAAAQQAADDRDGARPFGPHRHRNVSPLPVRRRGCHHRRGSPPVVKPVIKEFGGCTPWPMLTKMNYNDWSLLMKVKL